MATDTSTMETIYTVEDDEGDDNYVVFIIYPIITHESYKKNVAPFKHPFFKSSLQ